MQTVITIHLAGQTNECRLHEDAYEALRRYLDRARTRLAGDPDQAEVMADLERSIGAKLVDRLGSDDRILTLEDIDAVLEAVGPVGAGDDALTTVPGRPRRRKLYRIQEGQSIAGVCSGISAYSEIRVDWVRTIFFFLALATAGLFTLVYIVMAFVLPVVPTRAAWIDALDQER